MGADSLTLRDKGSSFIHSSKYLLSNYSINGPALGWEKSRWPCWSSSGTFVLTVVNTETVIHIESGEVDRSVWSWNSKTFLKKKCTQFGGNLDLPDVSLWKHTSVFKHLIGCPVCGRVCCLLHFLWAFPSKLFWGSGIVNICALTDYWNFLARWRNSSRKTNFVVRILLWTWEKYT